MGRTVSIYIDEELLKEVKRRGIPLSRAVREALRAYLKVQARSETINELEKILSQLDVQKALEDLEAIQNERKTDRW